MTSDTPQLEAGQVRVFVVLSPVIWHVAAIGSVKLGPGVSARTTHLGIPSA
jgi:hypothetical protein